jgi:MFS family permease
MLYTVIALPNIVFPFFIGIIIDFIGIRIAFVVLTFCVIVFQSMVAIGAATGSFQTMLIGRMFFGIAI